MGRLIFRLFMRQLPEVAGNFVIIADYMFDSDYCGLYNISNSIYKNYRKREECVKNVVEMYSLRIYA